MAINLTSTIADIEAKVAAANSSTSISDLYKIIIEATKVGAPVVEYDSAGAMPVDSAHVGSVLSTSAGGLFVLDSAGGSWKIAVGTPPPPPTTSTFQGSNFAYNAGGYSPLVNTIDKFSFASDGNATDTGDLSSARWASAPNSSSTDGYYTGGLTGPGTQGTNAIEKFPFASGGNSSNVGAFGGTGITYNGNGVQSSSDGYFAGGYGIVMVSKYRKFPFASDGNAVEVGSITNTGGRIAACSTTTKGFLLGSNSYFTSVFPFASEGDATVIGSLGVQKGSLAGHSGETHGYASGGASGPTPTTSYAIQKMNYTSDTDTVQVADLLVRTFDASGCSSTASGYTSGGQSVSSFTNVIQKFPFAADENATDVGDLTNSSRRGTSATQY